MEQSDELSRYQEQIEDFQTKLKGFKSEYQKLDSESANLRQQFDSGILKQKEYDEAQAGLFQEWRETKQQYSELESSINSLQTEFQNSTLCDSDTGKKIAADLNAVQAECNAVKNAEVNARNRIESNPLKEVQVVNRGVHVGKLASKVIRGTARRSIKLVNDADRKINPLKQRVNMNDVTDSGVESLRWAYSGYRKAKSTIRTAETSIRTTRSTIRLAENTVKGTAQAVKKTAVTSFRVARKTFKIGAFLVTHIVAVALNPIVWFVAGFAIVLFLIFSALMLLLGAGAAQQEQTQEAYGNPAGLMDIPANIQEAINYYQVACAGQRTEFSNLIDSFYYDAGNLSHSDLVYMMRNVPATTWEKSLATPTRKSQLKNAWAVTLPEAEAISIVYIDLQRQQNVASGTEMGIYEVEFKQEQFDALLDVCAVHTDTLYYGQECPSKNCSRHVRIQPNPDYTTYCQKRDQYADAYNAWLAIVEDMEIADGMSYPASNYYWNANVVPAVNQWQIDWQLAAPSNWSDNNGNTFLSTLGRQYEYYVGMVNSTPENIETPYYICDHNHTLHSVGLNFFDADAVMTQYGFSENEKAWERMICASISGFLASTPP